MIPTIRKPGSEIWVTFNPELETDDTYQRFVVHPPPGAVVVKTSYEDNDYLSDELRLEIEHLRTTDPDEYEYVYGGMCGSTVNGQSHSGGRGGASHLELGASRAADDEEPAGSDIRNAFSITNASFSPAPMFTAQIAYPGMAVRPLYRRGGVFATS